MQRRDEKFIQNFRRKIRTEDLGIDEEIILQ